uniref:Uncharacterized protein n=1 Tax=Arion vulgaris TaxID=1028688 RepID=A0A0B7ASJ5_9EUPU
MAFLTIRGRRRSILENPESKFSENAEEEDVLHGMGSHYRKSPTGFMEADTSLFLDFRACETNHSKRKRTRFIEIHFKMYAI